MIRLMGAILLAGGCGWLGIQASERLRKNSRAVRQMAQALSLLERELELGVPPLPQLLERVAKHSTGPEKNLFTACYMGLNGLEEENFSTIWKRQVEKQDELGPEGQEILIPLGNILGRYDCRAQKEAISTVRLRLEELAQHREEERRRQGRVYQVLGLSGGAFLVILLL